MSLVDQARRLELRDGDVICLPADTDPDQARELADALGPNGLNVRCLIVLGDVHSLDEAEMAAAGWYRR